TNAKTVPQGRNSYFDSKVLSRQHAEVWEDNGKIFIKDVKSSNGTFIKGERLSPERLGSDRGSPRQTTSSRLVSTSLVKTTRQSFIMKSLHALCAYSASSTR
ncbi:hypothetical protein C8Q73DRAFT_807850, partial [Cubamyces lactineus]